MDTIEGATVLVGSDARVLAELADALAAAGPLVVAGPTVIGTPEADPARAVLEVDVRSQADLDAAARRVVERWGPPGTLVVAPAPAPHVAFDLRFFARRDCRQYVQPCRHGRRHGNRSDAAGIRAP